MIDLNSIPQFAPGCRLHATQELLLIPEGVLQLSGPARDILSLVDGKRSVTELIGELSRQYSGADNAEIQNDVLGLFDRMLQRGVVRF